MSGKRTMKNESDTNPRVAGRGRRTNSNRSSSAGSKRVGGSGGGTKHRQTLPAVHHHGAPNHPRNGFDGGTHQQQLQQQQKQTSNINDATRNHNDGRSQTTTTISQRRRHHHRATNDDGEAQRRHLQQEVLDAPSPGARLTYADMASIPPRSLPPEDFQPDIRPGIRSPTAIAPRSKTTNTNNGTPAFIVLPPSRPSSKSSGRPSKSKRSSDPLPPVYLMRRGDDVQRAYAKIPKPPISLGHHGPSWGCVHFAVVYERDYMAESLRMDDVIVFRAPSENDAKYVAIKQLNKAVIQRYLDAKGEENPYKEIARMQDIGDNVHVLGCDEALEDDTFLYIVTPKACSEGTLKDVIPWFTSITNNENSLDRRRIHSIARKIFQILAYLEKHNVCHRDLSPDNFLFLTPDNLVVMDLALSIRNPIDPVNGLRTLTLPQGNFGTVAWMAPEIYANRVFCGVQADLWSVGICLYNMLTNQVLYHIPHATDISFLYFILARGLSSTPINERTVEVLMHTFGRSDDSANGGGGEQRRQRRQHELMAKAMAHLNFPPEVVEILEHLLTGSPAERWTLAQAMQSDYIRGVGEDYDDEEDDNDEYESTNHGGFT